MPTYELALVLRQMPRLDLISTLKRISENILDRGGIIRKLDNLGSRTLPFKISQHGLTHKNGSYFVIKFDTAPTQIDDLHEEYSRDVDIVRKNIFKVNERTSFECTLHEELLSPAYRKEVQEMIKIGQKKQRKRFNYNSGLDYYPFQK